MTMLNKSGTGWSETRDLRLNAGGALRRAQKAWVVTPESEWAEFYTYNPAILTEISATPSAAEVTSGSLTVFGVVSEVGTSAKPPAGSVVELYNGATQLAATTTNADGSYSVSWTPPAPGVFQLTAKFVGSGYWEPAQTVLPSVTVNSSTSITASWPVRGVIGQPFTVTGTVSADLSGTPTGSVWLEVQNGDSWSTGATAALSGGAYTLTWTPSATWSGAQAIRVRYVGSGRYTSSLTPPIKRTVYQPTPAAPEHTVKALGHTSLVLTITDQANVDRFVTTCVETGFAVTTSSTGTAGAELDHTWKVTPDYSYTFRIVAYSNNPVDGSTSGNTLYVTTGHAAQTDKGSGTFIFNAANTASWRPVDGWGYLGSGLAQGYWNNAHGPYTGVAGFDVAFMRSFIDGYGSAPRTGRWKHLTCTGLDVYVSRVPAGANASVPIGWHLSTTAPNAGSSAPALTSPVTSSPSGVAVGAAGWLTIPSTAYGDQLVGTSAVQSIAMYHNGSGNYAQFAGGSNFKIRVSYTWDWSPVPYVAPTWRSS